MKRKKVEMPQEIKDLLNTTRGSAMANQEYKKAIAVYEKYYKKYIFNIGQKYRLGLLYDHHAMGLKNEKQVKEYLNKAKALYREILKEEPSYFHALYGIGRLYSIQGDYKTALKYQIQAYNEMLKLPRSKRGALVIGYLYDELGDYDNAERWYLREYRDTPKDDFGTPLNLLQFYKKHDKVKKALKYALITEKLIKSEYKKKIYKGMNMNKSSFVLGIKNDIREIKKRAG
jgi:tetratricopeptide (TPR) repeat protein